MHHPPVVNRNNAVSNGCHRSGFTHFDPTENRLTFDIQFKRGLNANLVRNDYWSEKIIGPSGFVWVKIESAAVEADRSFEVFTNAVASHLFA